VSGSSPLLQAARLWERTSAKGTRYMSGRLGGVKLVIHKAAVLARCWRGEPTAAPDYGRGVPGLGHRGSSKASIHLPMVAGKKEQVVT
jgi:hypothetical protein